MKLEMYLHFVGWQLLMPLTVSYTLHDTRTTYTRRIPKKHPIVWMDYGLNGNEDMCTTEMD